MSRGPRPPGFAGDRKWHDAHTERSGILCGDDLIGWRREYGLSALNGGLIGASRPNLSVQSGNSIAVVAQSGGKITLGGTSASVISLTSASAQQRNPFNRHRRQYYIGANSWKHCGKTGIVLSRDLPMAWLRVPLPRPALGGEPGQSWPQPWRVHQAEPVPGILLSELEPRTP
jgi:hypothetical protein